MDNLPHYLMTSYFRITECMIALAALGIVAVPGSADVVDMRNLVLTEAALVHHYAFEPGAATEDGRGTLPLIETVYGTGDLGSIAYSPGFDATTTAFSPQRVGAGTEGGAALLGDGFLSVGNQLTVEALVRPAEVAGGGNAFAVVAGKYPNRGYFLYEDSDLHLGAWVGDGKQTFCSTEIGQWYYVAASFSHDGTDTTIDTYVANLTAGDMQPVHQRLYQSGIFGSGDQYLGVGAFATSTGQLQDAFSGTLDEVAVYNAALSSHTVRNHLSALWGIEIEPEPLPHAGMWNASATAHAYLWNDFIDPNTNQLYSYLDPTTREPLLPSYANVAAGIPSTGGWGTALEDCTLEGGQYLGTMVDRHANTQDPADADAARRMYQGLRTVAESSLRQGFIPRGVMPDGQAHYTQSSVDQYTLFAYGMWRYYRSDVATETEKAEIRAIYGSMLTGLEADGFVLLTEDEQTTTFGDLNALKPSRAERLLALVLAGADITQDAHWQDVYDALLPARLPHCHGGESAYQPWVLLQNQAAFNILRTLETDPDVLAVYEDAAEQIAYDSIPYLTGYDPLDRLQRRNALSGALVVAWSGDETLIEEQLETLMAICADFDPETALHNGKLVSNLFVPVESIAWALAAAGGGMPGDLNLDGFVGSDDLDLVRAHWGDETTPGDWSSGDASGDGLVSGDDLDMIRANWGHGIRPALASVPEPGMTVLLGILGWTVAVQCLFRRFIRHS